MGTIYKRGKQWYFDTRYKGRRIRRCVGSSKRIAELALKDAEVLIAREKFGFAKNDINVYILFVKCIEYFRANHRSTTTDRYRAVIDNFKEFLDGNSDVTHLSQISRELIDQYKSYRRRPVGKGSLLRRPKANTINFELDCLRMIFNLAIKWDYIEKNPVSGVTRLKTDDAKRPRFLSKQECSNFLSSCPRIFYPAFFTFLNTGMRKSELENLTWDDVDFNRGMILIRQKENWQPKSGEREIPINKGLLRILSKQRSKRRRIESSDLVFVHSKSKNSRNLLRLELIKIARKIGIKDFTKLHTLRHTFASHLVMNGVDLPTVKELMGHSDIETTMIYAHLSPDHLGEAVNKLPF